MGAADYTEGVGPENVTYTTHGPIVWFWDRSAGGWIEPRDMGWIPKIQAEVDERREKQRKVELAHFDLWEREMGWEMPDGT